MVDRGRELAVTPEQLRKTAVDLRDTADESRRNLAEFAGADDAVAIAHLRCAESYGHLADRVESVGQVRGAKLAAAADVLEANATAYAHNEAANSRLFPAS